MSEPPADSRRRPNGRVPSIALRTAEAIRNDALELADGACLGAQEELMRRYGVSRPTLLQAIGLVTQEKLLVSKTGPRGGYFVRRPDSKGVARAAAVYLRSREARMEETIRALAPVRIELAKLAARSTDPAARARLARFLQHEEQVEHQSGIEFMRAETELVDIICDLSGNSVFSLFYHILMDFINMTTPSEDIFSAHAGEVADYRSKRSLLARALLIQDEDLAALAAERCATSAAEWMISDLISRRGRSAKEGAASGRFELGAGFADAALG
jgi:DNA-binding FadR family transcriptional regulator